VTWFAASTFIPVKVLGGLVSMCGRFTLTLPPDAVAKALGYIDRPNFPPRYNIAPTQPIAVVLAEKGVRRFVLMRWGLIPSWVKDEKSFPLLINARGETLAGKPAFRNAFRRRRCLVPADGFYEWRRDGKARTPFHIRRPDRGLLAFAALWETWIAGDGSEIDTACIVTTTANGIVSAVHDRMPVIIDSADAAVWLDADQADSAAAAHLIRPANENALEIVAVNRAVNKAGSEGPELLDPPA
jgi:putative SOS response-associated peptidase YedK